MIKYKDQETGLRKDVDYLLLALKRHGNNLMVTSEIGKVERNDGTIEETFKAY